MSSRSVAPGKRNQTRVAAIAIGVSVFLASAGLAEPLSEATRKKLDRNWQICLMKKKGPFSANTCVCKDGSKEMVRKVNGKLVVPCGGAFSWCEAFRSDWGRALGSEGVWVGNLFQRDLYEWDSVGDPHALVQGYSLEHYFIEKNPGHKLDELRAYGGLSGAEYEAAALPRFLDRYVARPDFDPERHYLPTYELARRFRVRDDLAKIIRVRNLSSAIQAKDRGFKPYRDRTHNQISASLVPILQSYRDGLPAGSPLSPKMDELIVGVEELVRPTTDDLRTAVAALRDGSTKTELEAALSSLDGSPLDRAQALGAMMVVTRRAVSSGSSGSEVRVLMEIAVDAGALLDAELAAASPADRERLAQHTAVEAAFGAGLLTEDQYADLRSDVSDGDTSAMTELREVTTTNVGSAYAEVLPPWRHVAPSIDGFAADVVRASPIGVLPGDEG